MYGAGGFQSGLFLSKLQTVKGFLCKPKSKTL